MGSLTRSIWVLRGVLGDDTRAPRYIETVSTVGYRFISPVEAIEGPTLTPEAAAPGNSREASVVTESPTVVPAIPAQIKLRWKNWLWSLAAVGLAVLAMGYWYLRRPLPLPRLTNPVQLTQDGRRKNVVGTDGNRLYLNIFEPKAVGQVPVSGGQITEISFDLPSQGGLWGISSVSPDGSSLLAFDHFDPFREGARVSIVGILGHPVRYLTQSYPLYFHQTAGPCSIQMRTEISIQWRRRGRAATDSRLT